MNWLMYLKTVARGEIKLKWNTETVSAPLAYFFNTAKLFQCFSFRDVLTVWNKTAC